MEQHPYTVVLTGGPCAGKTTLLAWLEEQGRLGGRRLLFVPEAATILVQRGLVIGQDVVHFQTETMRLQLQLENEAWATARRLDEPCAVVCDRATLDGAGYCSDDQFESIADEFGYTPSALARRYDLVVHLVSAAVEAPEAYTTLNSEVRFESMEEAVAQERRTVDAWSRHPNRVIIGSSTGFQDKIDAAIEVIRAGLEGLERA